MKTLLLALLAGVVLALTSCGTAYEEANPGTLLKKYEWFKDQYAAARQISSRVRMSRTMISNFTLTLPADRSKWGYTDRDELSRLMTIEAGYLSQYAAIVAAYNAQASKFNWSFVQSYDCPRSLPEDAQGIQP
jgi:hypothetical protein